MTVPDSSYSAWHLSMTFCQDFDPHGSGSITTCSTMLIDLEYAHESNTVTKYDKTVFIWIPHHQTSGLGQFSCNVWGLKASVKGNTLRHEESRFTYGLSNFPFHFWQKKPCACTDTDTQPTDLIWSIALSPSSTQLVQHFWRCWICLSRNTSDKICEAYLVYNNCIGDQLQSIPILCMAEYYGVAHATNQFQTPSYIPGVFFFLYMY